MKEAIQTINYQSFTSLPIQTLVDTNNNGITIIVTTPMGDKTIDEQKISSAMFGANRNVRETGSEIIRQIAKLEQESRDLLLKEWLAKLR